MVSRRYVLLSQFTVPFIVSFNVTLSAKGPPFAMIFSLLLLFVVAPLQESFALVAELQLILKQDLDSDLYSISIAICPAITSMTIRLVSFFKTHRQIDSPYRISLRWMRVCL